MTDEEAVLARVRERAEALVAGDADRLTELLHERFVWTSHRGEVLDRQSYLRANTRNLVWRSQLVLDPAVAVVADTAVVVGTVQDEVERDGRPARFEMRMTQTWVRTGAQWRCLSGHAGPLTA